MTGATESFLLREVARLEGGAGELAGDTAEFDLFDEKALSEAVLEFEVSEPSL